MGEEPPEGVTLPQDVPEWAGGLSMIDSYLEESDYCMVDTGGNGNRLIEALKYYDNNLNVSQLQSKYGVSPDLDQIDSLAEEIGHHIVVYDLEGIPQDQWDPIKDTSGASDGLWLVYCSENTNIEGDSQFRPLIERSAAKEEQS